MQYEGPDRMRTEPTPEQRFYFGPEVKKREEIGGLAKNHILKDGCR
jgi:hypothetical protein